MRHFPILDLGGGGGGGRGGGLGFPFILSKIVGWQPFVCGSKFHIVSIMLQAYLVILLYNYLDHSIKGIEILRLPKKSGFWNSEVFFMVLEVSLSGDFCVSNSFFFLFGLQEKNFSEFREIQLIKLIKQLLDKKV